MYSIGQAFTYYDLDSLFDHSHLKDEERSLSVDGSLLETGIKKSMACFANRLAYRNRKERKDSSSLGLVEKDPEISDKSEQGRALIANPLCARKGCLSGCLSA